MHGNKTHTHTHNTCDNFTWEGGREKAIKLWAKYQPRQALTRGCYMYPGTLDTSHHQCLKSRQFLSKSFMTSSRMFKILGAFDDVVKSSGRHACLIHRHSYKLLPVQRRCPLEGGGASNLTRFV